MGVLDALLDSPRLSESFDSHEHPRDFLGRFKATLSGLAIGGSAKAPGGITVTRRAEGFHISGGAGLGHYKHSSGEMRTGKHAADETLSNPQSAAMLAVTRSLRSRKPDSFGGGTHYQSLDDYEKSKGKPGGGYEQWKRENLHRGHSEAELTRAEYDRVMKGQEAFYKRRAASNADATRKREGGLKTTQHGPRPRYYRNADGDIAPPPRAPGTGSEANRKRRRK